jgi:hypothetical protein
MAGVAQRLMIRCIKEIQPIIQPDGQDVVNHFRSPLTLDTQGVGV